MRTLENYELVISGEEEDKLLLTFDWDDLPQLPHAVSSVVVDTENSHIKVEFEDDKRWEEIHFVNLPVSLQDMMREFPSIFVVGLSDEVEMFAESPLHFTTEGVRDAQAK